MITAEAEDGFLEDWFFWSAGQLPVMLQPLQRLTALQLCGMEIRTLPACFTALGLSALSLADNRLLDLPYGKYLESLHFLDIRWNRIESVPSCLVECRCLQHLLLNPAIPDPDTVLPGLLSRQPGLGDVAAAQAARWKMFQLRHCSMTFCGENSKDPSWERPSRNLYNLPA